MNIRFYDGVSFEKQKPFEDIASFQYIENVPLTKSDKERSFQTFVKDIDSRRVQHVHRLLFPQALGLLNTQPQKRKHAVLSADKTEVSSSRSGQCFLKLTP